MIVNNLEILGKTLISVDVDRENNEIYFTCSDGSEYCMFHIEDCCESVTIEDINGDIVDIIASPILVAEERISDGENDYGTETHTFYTISTIKGTVDIRWYGSSNGYYSESVDFKKRTEDTNKYYNPTKWIKL